MFTVVIPLYNKELSINNTIQSVLNQTYQDFEIVVINDGSTDNSVKMVKSIKDNRIRLIQQENQGVSAARNRGIKEASYEWIAFLDGDDLWEINHLKEIHKMMVTFPNEKVYVTSFEYSDGREMFKYPRQTQVFKVENYFKEAIKENIIWTSIVVAHKDCFKVAGMFNILLTRGEDLDLWARIASNFWIIKSAKVTAVYRIEAENRTSLINDIEKTYISIIDLDKTSSKDELRYYRFLILRKMYEYTTTFNFKNFIKIKSKHNISFMSFFNYAIIYNYNRALRLKNKLMIF